MAAQTLAQLETRLDDSLSWRRAELLALQAAIAKQEKSSTDAPLTRALARGGTALLYAHWEGYAKEACEAYLDFVAVRRLRYGELGDGFLVTALTVLLRRLETGDDKAREDLMDVVRRPEMARARVPRKAVINTRSNLRYNVLLEMCEAVGLPADDFVTRQQFIDRSLCDARNEVAHGRLYFPEASTFADNCDAVLRMLERLRTLIIQNARQAQYRHTPSS